LFPRIGFIVTNRSDPTKGILSLYNGRGTVDKRRQVRPALDEALPQEQPMKKRGSWPFCSGGLMSLAVLLFALPKGFEGPVLVPISPGHALAVLDSVALLPLLVGTGVLGLGLWQRRRWLGETMCLRPNQAIPAVFAAGIGVGLLVASAFSAFFWWWAIGAGLLAAVIVVALVAASRA
jgi:hypothetical protein